MIVELFEYMDLVDVELLCSECLHGWTEGYPEHWRLENMECPQCEYVGGIIFADLEMEVVLE